MTASFGRGSVCVSEPRPKGAVLIAIAAVAICIRAAPAPAEFLNYDQAAAALNACKLPSPAPRAGWQTWVQSHDQEIRSRILRGEEDSLANFILFGVSFTSEPRVDPDRPDPQLIRARIDAFVKASESPGSNERLRVLRNLVAAHSAPAQFLRENIDRNLAERQQYRRVLDRAPAASAELYRNRGLAPDTNFRPNYAIERALADLKTRGALTSIRRAAIIGPGLDFTDKDSGFDYYPLQSIQPFALIDSLLKLVLAKLPDLRVSVFDINPQVLDHLSPPRQPYTIQLVLDPARPWSRDTLAYWHQFGAFVGISVPPLSPPSQLRNLQRRAVQLNRGVTATLDPRPLNVVLQHDSQQYDLIVATNVFVYYDRLDQALALLNIQSMLNPGGLFLVNSPVLPCPGQTLHPTGHVDVQYSSQPGDNDRVDLYSNSPLGRPLGPE